MVSDHKNDDSVEEPENGILAESGEFDTSSLGFLDGHTAQISVILPGSTGEDDDYVDDDIDDAHVLFEALLNPEIAPVSASGVADVITETSGSSDETPAADTAITHEAPRIDEAALRAEAVGGIKGLFGKRQRETSENDEVSDVSEEDGEDVVVAEFDESEAETVDDSEADEVETDEHDEDEVDDEVAAAEDDAEAEEAAAREAEEAAAREAEEAAAREAEEAAAREAEEAAAREAEEAAAREAEEAAAREAEEAAAREAEEAAAREAEEAAAREAEEAAAREAEEAAAREAEEAAAREAEEAAAREAEEAAAREAEEAAAREAEEAAAREAEEAAAREAEEAAAREAEEAAALAAAVAVAPEFAEESDDDDADDDDADDDNADDDATDEEPEDSDDNDESDDESEDESDDDVEEDIDEEDEDESDDDDDEPDQDDSVEEEQLIEDPADESATNEKESVLSPQQTEAPAKRNPHDLERVNTRQEIPMTSKRLGDLNSASRETSDLLTADRLLDPGQLQKPEPEGAWRHLIYSLTGKRINLGDSKSARARKELTARIAAPLSGGSRFVPVLSRKGGVGKTTVTALLGMALADARDDRVIAVDANPDRGTLAERIARPSQKTVRDLVRVRDNIRGFNDLSEIVARDETRLDVLASETDPRVSEAFSDDDYRHVAEVTARYYSLVLTDTGTGIVHSVMGATLDLADQLIIVAGLSVDEARLASETITWLETNGFGEQARNAIVVLNQGSPGAPLVRRTEVEAHFRTRVRDVVSIPYDTMIATGSAITFRDLQPETREAARTLAAKVIETLRQNG